MSDTSISALLATAAAPTGALPDQPGQPTPAPEPVCKEVSRAKPLPSRRVTVTERLPT